MEQFRNRIVSLTALPLLTLAATILLSALPRHVAPQTPAGEVTFALDPGQSKLHWMLDTTLHAVHGTFAFKQGTIRLDPATGKASGEIVADAASGNSGNDSRDKKMHKDVLQSGKYGEIIFRPNHVEGKVDLQGASMVQVHGTFLLHGSEHELTVPVQVEFAGEHWTARAKFSVPFIEWGLKNPSNFFLRVNHQVEVELELAGTVGRRSPE